MGLILARKHYKEFVLLNAPDADPALLLEQLNEGFMRNCSDLTTNLHHH